MNAPEGHAPAQNDTAATTNSSASSTAPDANVQSLIEKALAKLSLERRPEGYFSVFRIGTTKGWRH